MHGFRFLTYISILITLFMAACSAEPVKKPPDTVDFIYLTGRWTDSNVYELGEVFEDVDIDLVFKAARAGLLHAEFEIVESDDSQHFVSGKRDTRAMDVFLYPEAFITRPHTDYGAAGASVYLNTIESDVIAKVIYKLPEGTVHIYGQRDGYSKNPAIHKDINKIFHGMSAFLIDQRIRLQRERRERDSET